jgi:hypothetical protein
MSEILAVARPDLWCVGALPPIRTGCRPAGNSLNNGCAIRLPQLKSRFQPSAIDSERTEDDMSSHASDQSTSAQSVVEVREFKGGVGIPVPVPANATSALIEAMGAQGGHAHDNDTGGDSGGAGWGAIVRATVSVTPGETLIVSVGDQPGGSGGNGFTRGGPGGIGRSSDGMDGAGGGGSTGVARGKEPLTVLVVAGGGGGAGGASLVGNGGTGGGGGLPPADGHQGGRGTVTSVHPAGGGRGGDLNASSRGNYRNAPNDPKGANGGDGVSMSTAGGGGGGGGGYMVRDNRVLGGGGGGAGGPNDAAGGGGGGGACYVISGAGNPSVEGNKRQGKGYLKITFFR